MPTIEMSRSHSLGTAEASRRVRLLVDDFAEQRKELIDTIEWSQDGSSALAKGKGFSAKFAVDDASAKIEVDLSLMLRPFKKKVRARLESKMGEVFDA